jgi:pyruvate ferredoxin oxidoreductase gamma subunit
MIKRRLNIRMSGLGGQGAVTAAHVLAMAANRDGKFSISNPFFGAEKRMAPAESYCEVKPLSITQNSPTAMIIPIQVESVGS